MKLYHFPISPNSRRVVAVIHHLGLECELIALDLSKGEHLTPEFISLNPNHMIPTLVDGDTVLWESNAIMQYLCAKVGDDS
ncbi:glutathione S-transferase family protein, partial [Methylocucumis oryzae]